MKNMFFRFDRFLISKMLETTPDECLSISEEARYNAYRICLSHMGNRRTISTQALKKWFGIDTIHKPSRDKIILMFFELSLSDEEAREWLVKGALEPDFQVNDFTELIYLYGLHQHFTYEECQSMITDFIAGISPDFSPQTHNHTTKLWESYRQNCSLSREEYLDWMLSIQTELKGYSLTILDYFKDLKSEIVKEIRMEAEKDLQYYLAETSIISKINNHPLDPSKRRRTILRYLKRCEEGKENAISPELINCIRELLVLSETPLESNTVFLSEVYPKGTAAWKNHTAGILDYRIMNDKYLSEILSVGMQKEKELRLLIQNASRKEWKEQKKRCRIINRHDLLPLILCVSQKRYLREFGDIHYEQKEALGQFEHLANRILVGCNMVTLQPESLQLDFLLYRCYGKDEMYSFSEILSQYYKTNDN